MEDFIQFPEQQKPFRQKGVKWRKQCVDWAASKTYFNYSPVRKSVRAMKINQDLLDGIIHMEDIARIINPSNTKAEYIPDQIQHYPIINAKLNVLQGEEFARTFDCKVVVTNPNSISEIETAKRDELVQKLQSLIEDQSMSEDEFNQNIEKMDYFFNYEWQDMRETRANALLSHYIKELDIKTIFNAGFVDAMKFGEEIYDIGISGGEPYIEKVNPLKIRIFRSGYSNRVEDADIIILEDFWSPGKIIDRFYDVLTPEDVKYIESIPNTIGGGVTDSMDNYDERAGYINRNMVTDTIGGDFYTDLFAENGAEDTLMPFDFLGNVRVIRVFWKSRRKIKKVKSYDENGSTTYTFYPETYITKTDLGEEEKTMWINEAWEGTLIGEKVYVNMRPRTIQYNRLSNPSRCHFGIIGTIYNKNDDKPFSLVDMMKPYSYYYDAIHDRLNKLIERNWGKIIRLDLAKVPKGWTVDKWLYYAKTNSLAVEDSFKEGNVGVATGKLAGSLNNASSGVINAEIGNSIQTYLGLLEFIKGEMSEVVGITRQREGQTGTRETVGGVERATLQSSHITEWLFVSHDNLKKRVLEAFLETAKIALRGRKAKFQYLLSNGQQKIMDIDGDEFAESDYGLVVDSSYDTQKLNQSIGSLAQAAIQNQYSLSSVMKLFTSTSIMEKIRLLEREEQQRQQQASEAQQQQMQIQQQQMQQQVQMAQAQMEQQYRMNQENNDTKVRVAEINSKAEADRLALMNGDDGVEEMSKEAREKIKEAARQFDAKQRLEREKLEFEKSKAAKDRALKEKQIAKTSVRKI